MKKRALALCAVVVMVMTMLAGCKYTTCDFCGEKKMCDKEEIFGQKIYYCNDCEDALSNGF